MKEKAVAILIFALFVISSIPVMRVKASPTVWNVPMQFPTITAALTSGLVMPGDTIHVWNGAYVENPLVSIPNIKIIGQSVGGVTVTAAGPGPCFQIFAPGVTIMELTIICPVPFPGTYGVYIFPSSTACKIWNNVIKNFDYGVVIVNSPNNEIIGNDISNSAVVLGPPGPLGSCSAAIMIQGAGAVGNQVRGNEVGQTAPDWYGLGTWGASGNTITLNNFWAIMNFPAAFFAIGDANTWDSSGTGLTVGNWWTGFWPPPYIIGGPNIDFFCHPIPYTWAAYPWDINRDGKCNMVDIGTAARAFNTQWSMPDWNPKADMTGPSGVPDGKVDMRDIGLAARNFGWIIP